MTQQAVQITTELPLITLLQLHHKLIRKEMLLVTTTTTDNKALIKEQRAILILNRDCPFYNYSVNSFSANAKLPTFADPLFLT